MFPVGLCIGAFFGEVLLFLAILEDGEAKNSDRLYLFLICALIGGGALLRSACSKSYVTAGNIGRGFLVLFALILTHIGIFVFLANVASPWALQRNRESVALRKREIAREVAIRKAKWSEFAQVVDAAKKIIYGSSTADYLPDGKLSYPKNSMLICLSHVHSDWKMSEDECYDVCPETWRALDAASVRLVVIVSYENTRSLGTHVHKLGASYTSPHADAKIDWGIHLVDLPTGRTAHETATVVGEYEGDHPPAWGAILKVIKKRIRFTD
jgi:hypothetical protein